MWYNGERCEAKEEIGGITVIEVKNLVKKYGDHVAVNDLSFNIEKGKIYGFLGPNGAGKSTTMNIITGYLAPTSGEVVVNGHNIYDEPEAAKKCIGYLPEIPPGRVFRWFPRTAWRRRSVRPGWTYGLPVPPGRGVPPA